MSRVDLACRLTAPALATIALLSVSTLEGATTPAHPFGRIVITDVTVVDPSGARAFPQPVTVVIDAGHIVSVGPKPAGAAPRDAQVIAGRGRFLIPGLWDMHVHVTDAGEGALGA